MLSYWMHITDAHAFRNAVTTALEGPLGQGPKSAANLERGVFNAALGCAAERGVVKRWDNPAFCRLYTDRLRSVHRNLADPTVADVVRSGRLQPHQLAFLSHQELRPEKWSALLDAKKARDACLYEPQLDANTDNFRCRKCKSNRCSYYQLQTRSADEPMTTFVTCINCGNRWKC
jgi:transcription elongation factor S-II